MELTIPTFISGALLILLSIAGTLVLILAVQLKPLRAARLQLQHEVDALRRQYENQEETFKAIQDSRDKHKLARERLEQELEQVREYLTSEKKDLEIRFQQQLSDNRELKLYIQNLEKEKERTTIEVHQRMQELIDNETQLHERIRQLQIIREQLTREKETLESQRASELLTERLRICAAISETVAKLEEEVRPTIISLNKAS